MPDDRMNKTDIATPREVLETFTALMRGEKPAEQMKAAETLAKHYGLLTPREDAVVRPEIAQEIEAAMAELPDPPLP